MADSSSPVPFAGRAQDRARSVKSLSEMGEFDKEQNRCWPFRLDLSFISPNTV